MYFSKNNGIVAIPNAVGQTADALIAALASEGYGQVKKGVQSEARETYTTNVLACTRMFSLPTVGAGFVASTISDLFPIPGRVKIPKIAIACSAISTTDGSITANIVVGSGSYDTAAVQASGTYTLTGTPTNANTNTYTIGGHAVVSNQATANSLSQQATADANAINADGTVGALVHATAVGAVITIKYNEYGTSGNGVTTTGTSSGGDTVTANQASLTGGVAATGITVPQNDNSSSSGFCTNVAPAGSALFAQDIPFNTTVFPGLTTGSGGFSAPLGLIPTFPDAVFSQLNGPLTLRLNTPAGTGSITQLVVTAYMEIQPLSATFPSQNQSPPLGIPFPGIDL